MNQEERLLASLESLGNATANAVRALEISKATYEAAASRLRSEARQITMQAYGLDQEAVETQSSIDTLKATLDRAVTEYHAIRTERYQ